MPQVTMKRADGTCESCGRGVNCNCNAFLDDAYDNCDVCGRAACSHSYNERHTVDIDHEMLMRALQLGLTLQEYLAATQEELDAIDALLEAKF